MKHLALITLNFAITSVLVLWAVAMLYAFVSAIWKRRKAGGDGRAVVREIAGQTMVKYCRNHVPAKLIWLLVVVSLALIAAGVFNATT